MKFVYFIIICVVIYLYIKSYDHFDVTAYNDDYIKNDKSAFDLTTINDILVKHNKDSIPVNFKETYRKLPDYIQFPWKKIFNKNILERFTDVFSEHKTYNIIKDMYDIYSYDINNRRNFVFKVDIKNDTLKWATTFKIFAIIDNIQNFLTDTGDYIQQIDGVFESKLQKNINVIAIVMDLLPLTSEINGFADQTGYEDFTKFYTIKNTLSLMDPFLTSGKDMLITPKMRMDFESELKMREERDKDKLRPGFCYNINGKVNTKEECTSSGGVWDYPPKNSEECPYYSSNKNYPNNFGGLQGDKCNLPRNMQLVGNRNYSANPEYAPICYNCNPQNSKMIGEGTLGFCCEDQKDKTRYSKLTSPDYAFNGDQEIRNKYSDRFTMLGLSIN